MKNKKIIKNYFSKTLLLLSIAFFCSFFPLQTRAQLSFGGKQIMYWNSSICNNSGTNVHFILSRTKLVGLYDGPSTETKGDSSVEFGVSQVGTYEPVPVECIANIAGAPVVLWVADGTYMMVSTGITMKDKFFAGAINPFIKKININA
ncbi:MAG: hypothetical protein WCO65_03015 [bacterium]